MSGGWTWLHLWWQGIRVLSGLGAHALLQARNIEMLLECFYHLEDFSSLVKLMDLLPDGSHLLVKIGDKLQSVGLSSDCVTASLKVQGNSLDFGNN